MKDSDMTQKSTASGSTEKSDPVPAAASGTAETSNREEVATKLVDRFALWSGAAGLIPVPVVDALAVGGVQLQMLRKLSQVYGIPFTENRGKALIASLAGAAIPATSGIGAASLLKSIPIVGTAISSVVMPTLSAGFTYAIGKVFIQHFSSGGTLLDFNPPDYREFIKSQKELWSTRTSSTSSGSASSHTTESSTAGKGTATASP
jgi:uncharacterized protein (DUF697 family)